MPHATLRLALATTAGLALCTGTAAATEGPPPGAAPPLPNPLAPVAFPPAGAPPAAAGPYRLPRVVRARLHPRRVRVGHRSRLVVHLATPGRVRVTVTRLVHGRRVRVSTRIVRAPKTTLVVRTSAHLRRGRYRITIVAYDRLNLRSAAVNRSLRVVR
jgi:hypothetical protein